MTGASGRYGRLATQKLIGLGRARDLILITRTPEKLADCASAGCDVRFGDFDQPTTLEAAIRDADKLMLISGTRVGTRAAAPRARVEAAVAGVRQIVYTSFVNVDPANPALVAIDHRETGVSRQVERRGLTFLRDAHYADAMILNAGPGFLASGAWLTSTRGGREAMVWREDCVDCAVAVLTQDRHENTSYHVTGPNRETFAEVAAMLSEVTARPVRLVETDDAGMYAHFDALGIPREPVDDQTVAGIPWNSDDMVSRAREPVKGRRPHRRRRATDRPPGALGARPDRVERGFFAHRHVTA